MRPSLTRRAPGEVERSDDRPVLGGLVALAVVVAVLAVSVFYSLPSNVLSVRDGGPVRVFSAKALPQGWAFFTKPPSDAELVAYRVVDGRLDFASLTPNSRADNLFGLTRTQRAQGPEIAAMANQVEDWTSCPAGSGDCLAPVAGSATEVEIENTSPVPTLCGPTVLVETEPVPFAFRGRYDGWRLDRRFVLIEAVCP